MYGIPSTFKTYALKFFWKKEIFPSMSLISEGHISCTQLKNCRETL